MDWSEIFELRRAKKQREFDRKYKILEPETVVSHVDDMGEFVEGYDVRNGFNFSIKTIGSFLLYVLFVVSLFSLILILPFISEEMAANVSNLQRNPKIYILLIIFTVLFILITWGAVDNYKNWKQFPRGVLIYEYGFILLNIDKYTKELKEKKRFYFDNIREITCSKHKINNHYLNTSYELSIIGTTGEKLWEQDGDYDNQYDQPNHGGWKFAILQAMLKQWAKVYIKRELAKNGYVLIEAKMNVVIGEGYIQSDELRIDKDNMVYEFDDDFLKINVKTREKGWFCGNDFSFNFVKMENGHILLYAAEHLLDIKRTDNNI